MSVAFARSADQRSLLQGPHVAGRRIYRNDSKHTLIVDSRLFHLSPLAYNVCLPLLRQRERWEHGSGAAPLWMSAEALGRASGITDLLLLRRHVNRVSNELAATGICFVRTQTADGDLYQALLREKDVVHQGEKAR